MLWFLVVLTGLVVVAIALVSVGRVTFSLAERPRESSYELDEAVEFVADRLSDEVTAVLSYDDVRVILTFHLDYLEVKGVAHEASEAAAVLGAVGRRAQQGGDSAEDHEDDEVSARAGGDDQQREALGSPAWPEPPAAGPLVADDDEALPYILGRLEEDGRAIDDVWVVQVLDVERTYLDEIGAIGVAVADPTMADGGPDAADP